MVDGTGLDPADFAAAFKRFMESVAEQAPGTGNPVREMIMNHLGVEPARLPVVGEDFEAWDRPNLQLALDAYLAVEGRRHRLVGIASEASRLGADLSDLIARHAGGSRNWADSAVDYVNIELRDRSLACINVGLLLVHDRDVALVVLVDGSDNRGMQSRRPLRMQVMAADIETAQQLLREVRQHMDTLDVYRGNVVSLELPQQGPYVLPGTSATVRFHDFPATPRDDVILPAGLLDRLERHAVVFSAHAAQLRELGRSLKRGILLYGPPGTGKTHTVRYLSGCMPGRTVVLLNGRFHGLISAAAALARRLQPAMLVLEDVDLIAEERGLRPVQQLPLLYELLNEMDGLREDADVIFLLTTNRADVLEPALAGRPGRVDLAVELPLPDAAGRRRLLDLYSRNLDVVGDDLESLVARTEGVSPAFIKELVRKALLLAAEAGAGRRLGLAHLETALEELTESVLTRRLLGAEPVPDLPAQLPAHPQSH